MSTSTLAPLARLPALPRLPPRTSRAVRQTIGGLIVAAAAVAAALLMLHGTTTLKGVAAVIVVLGSVWFATTRHAQLALAVWMLYLGFLDGYLKLATGSGAVTFVRDAFLFALVIGLLVRATVQGKRLPLPPLSGWVIAFAVIVFVQVANPQAGTVVHSLAGVRQHLEFVPLFFLTAAYVRTTRALRIFCILLAVIAAGNAIVGWVQFNETPQQFAAWGAGYAQRVNGTGTFAGGGRTFVNAEGQPTRTRPFGLGSDAGDGGLFCMLALCGILALAAFTRRRRYQLFAVAMALAALLGIITSEGRGVVVTTVIAVIAYGLLTVKARNRMTSVLGFAVAVAASVFFIQAIVGAVGSSGLRYAGLTPNGILSTTSKARGLSIDRIPSNLITYPLGAGLATAGPAALTVQGASQLTLTSPPDTETEFSFLIVETGIPGLLVVTGFTLMLLLLGFRRIRQEPDHEARVLLAALIAPIAAIFALFFSSTVTPSVPVAPYLWAVGGIVSYWLIALPAARRRAAASAANLPAAGGTRPRLRLRLQQSPLRTPARSAAP